MLRQTSPSVIAINRCNNNCIFSLLNLVNAGITLNMSHTSQQQAFLFMPDISGFTKFIGETEIEHSSHIIQELLEIIINENRLNMEMMEIEGDAVFFFRFGKIPSADEVIGQAKSIFEKFHQHLLQYENRRICQCGACKTANNLTLKFIIHTGTVGSYYVRSQHKLIGKDIIILHRLLKNKIPGNEYLLFTKPFFEALNNKKLNGLQLSMSDESEEIDGVIVSYKYAPIKHWLSGIEAPEEDKLSKPANMVPVNTASAIINSPADIIFSYIADLSKRPEWMNSVRIIELNSSGRLNQVGTVHKCILENSSSIAFQTNYFEHGENDFIIAEIDNNRKAFGHQFTVEYLSAKESTVKIQFLVRNNFFYKVMFNLFMKTKMEQNIKKSLSNLRTKFEGYPS